jgi:replication fork protection complex subunit Csm3/Swi3
MPAATSDHPAGGDDLDNLLDYDGAVEDFWKDLPDTSGVNANDTNNAQPEMDMDEEVKVTKKRKPNPKLDQER